MFVKLMRKVFPSFVPGETQANYEYFEQTRNSNCRLKSLSTTKAPAEMTTNSSQASRKYTFKFTNKLMAYLFNSTQSCQADVEADRFIGNQLQQFLRSPEELLDALPVLPDSLSKVLQISQDPEFELAALLDVIKSEPSMVADVINLANSSQYRRSERDVVDLHKAFMAVGTKGLFEGVLQGHFKQFSNSSNVSCRLMGDKIWHLALLSGKHAEVIATNSLEQNKAAPAYLIGLMQYLGVMILFQLASQAMSYLRLDGLPERDMFESLINEHALTLSILIAEHWQLPEIIKSNLINLSLESQISDELLMCILDAQELSFIDIAVEQGEITQEQLADTIKLNLQLDSSQVLAKQQFDLIQS